MPDSKRGRPTKLDEQGKRQLLRCIMHGATREEAAAEVGCSARTLRRVVQADTEFAWRLRTATRVRDQLQGRLTEDWRSHPLLIWFAKELRHQMVVHFAAKNPTAADETT